MPLSALMSFVKFLLPILLYQSYAMAAAKVDLNYHGPISTDDSRVDFSGTMPMDLDLATRDVHIWVTFNGVGGFAPEIVIAPNRSFNQRVSLKYGPGTYKVEIGYFKPHSSDLVTIGDFTVENTDPKDESYLLPSYYVESDAPEIKALSSQIIRQASAITDLAKAKALHNWVSTNIKYEEPGRNTALYTLKSGSGVCQDYSNLFAALGRAAGLATKIIGGIGIVSKDDQGPHAWNEISVDGRWVTIDTTWDAVDGEEFFDMDPTIFAKTHVASEGVLSDY
jgi:transglutaminase-like putative cysteine protease